MKIRKICVYFLLIIKQFFTFDARFIFREEVTKRKVLILMVTSQNVNNSSRISSTLTYSLYGLHTGRFTVEFKEYGNTLFSYFEFFIYVSSNIYFRLNDYRVYAVSHGLEDSQLLYLI